MIVKTGSETSVSNQAPKQVSQNSVPKNYPKL